VVSDEAMPSNFAALVALAPLAVGAFCAGCAPPQGSLASAQEAAQELNLDARFGRSEIAMDHVAPDAREDFAAHHRGWGTSVRIADVELAGMRAHGEHDVDVLVHVAWYRPEQQELRTTTLKQGWRDKNGWQLVAEQRLDGDVGLLGDPVIFERPAVERPAAQFPTVRLGGSPSPSP
jgi:hypothetical protein